MTSSLNCLISSSSCAIAALKLNGCYKRIYVDWFCAPPMIEAPAPARPNLLDYVPLPAAPPSKNVPELFMTLLLAAPITPPSTDSINHQNIFQSMLKRWFCILLTAITRVIEAIFERLLLVLELITCKSMFMDISWAQSGIGPNVTVLASGWTR